MEFYEHHNINALRKYPFMSTSSMKAKNKFIFPNSVILDLVIQVPTNYQKMMYMSEFSYTDTEIYVSISLTDTQELITEGTCVPGETNLVLDYGKLQLGELVDLPLGQYTFEPYSSVIEPCRILKLAQGISSINGITEGSVTLTTGSNVKIEVIGSTIKIDTQDGLCACEDNPCIKTINGIEPINNNFTLEGSGCTKLTPMTGGLLIENICETACCGCETVNDFIDRINILEKRILALESGS